LGEETAAILISEGQLIESLGAIYFLLGSLLFLLLFFYAPRRAEQTDTFAKKKYFYLLLSIILLMGFLEEISWGQRIFNLRTPQLFLENNLQEEINIHNLTWFKDHQILNITGLFIIFCLSFFVAIPILYKLSSSMRALINKSFLPVVPLSLGLLLLANYLSLWIKYSPVSDQLIYFLEEVRESKYAFLFMCFALYERNRIRSNSLTSGHSSSQRVSASSIGSPNGSMNGSFLKGEVKK